MTEADRKWHPTDTHCLACGAAGVRVKRWAKPHGAEHVCPSCGATYTAQRTGTADAATMAEIRAA